ncbi:MAG: DUF4190 domain-containing protein [Pseudonocardiaceae bacterium]
MSAPPYPAQGQYPLQPQAPLSVAIPPKNGMGTAGFVLGLLAALFAIIPLIGVIAWPLSILGLVFGIVGISRAREGVATNKGLAVSGTVLASIGLVLCLAWAAAFGSAASEIGSSLPSAPPAPAEADSALAFGDTWTSDNGNTIVAGQPQVATSESPLSSGESVLRVPVTLTNNGAEEWNTVFTTFGGTLDGVPVQESVGEGDWMYSTPLDPGASVTLTKVFVGGPGEFTLSLSTPHGIAFFTGQV